MGKLTKYELQNFFRRRAVLDTNEQTLAGLKEYAKQVDSQGIQDGILHLESSIEKLKQGLEADGKLVLETFALIEDDMARIALQLHYYEGYSWELVATIIGKESKHALMSRTRRSLNAAGMR